MKKLTLVMTGIVLALSTTAFADDCKVLVVADKITAPGDATTVVLVNTVETPAKVLVTVESTLATVGNDKQWTVTQGNIDTIKARQELTTTDRGRLRIAFQKADNTLLAPRLPFRLSTEAADIPCSIIDGDGGTDVGRGDDVATDECDRLGKNEEAELEKRRKANKEAGFTQLVFDREGSICFANRRFGVVGDPIYIYLLNDGSLSGRPRATFTPCALEPATPSVHVPATFPTIPPEQKTVPASLLALPMRRCFNTQVNLTIQGRFLNEAQQEQTFEFNHGLEQYNRYHAGLQIGIIASEQHDVTFGLRDEGTVKKIYNKGTIDDGPEYVTTLVFYSFPRYLREMFTDYRFYGRDIVNDKGWQDRLGGILGVGVSAPRNRFVAGFSFDLGHGMNVVGVQEFVRITELAGVNEGDAFAGAETAIPTRKRWNSETVIGLSLDVRYLTALFSRQ